MFLHCPKGCFFTLAAYSGKRNVTVWRPSVCRSVCLSLRHTYRDSSGAACDTASVHFGQTIRMTDILVCFCFKMVTNSCYDMLVTAYSHLFFHCYRKLLTYYVVPNSDTQQHFMCVRSTLQFCRTGSSMRLVRLKPQGPGPDRPLQ